MKTTAFEKVCNYYARNHSVNWMNVLCGRSRVTVDPSEYKVKLETLRKQANKQGFKTTMWGDSLQIYR